VNVGKQKKKLRNRYLVSTENRMAVMSVTRLGKKVIHEIKYMSRELDAATKHAGILSLYP